MTKGNIGIAVKDVSSTVLALIDILVSLEGDIFINDTPF
jgi:hypothetical protein